MISMLRIDDRLIHGQIAIVWSKTLGVSRIIVANDTAANNEFQKNSLKMATPEGIKSLVCTVEKAIGILNNPKSKDLKILLIVDTPEDMLTIVEKVSDIEVLNIGNYGRAKGIVSEKKKLGSSLYITNQDAQIFKEIISKEQDISYQQVPSSNGQSMNELLKGE